LSTHELIGRESLFQIWWISVFRHSLWQSCQAFSVFAQKADMIHV